MLNIKNIIVPICITYLKYRCLVLPVSFGERGQSRRVHVVFPRKNFVCLEWNHLDRRTAVVDPGKIYKSY